MSVHFVLLAYGTSFNKFDDVGGESWPPEVMFKECFGVESSCMTKSGGTM